MQDSLCVFDSCVAVGYRLIGKDIDWRRVDCLVCETCFVFFALRRHVFVLCFGQRETKRGEVEGVLAIVCFDMCSCGEDIHGATCRLLV